MTATKDRSYYAKLPTDELKRLYRQADNSSKLVDSFTRQEIQAVLLGRGEVTE